MNTIDDRISAALRAQAESLTEADLSEASPPVGPWGRPARGRWTAPLLAAAVVGILAAGTVTAVELSRSDHASPAIPPMVSVSPSPSGVAPTPSASTPAPSASSPAGSRTAPSQSTSRTPSHSATQPAPAQSASRQGPSQSTSRTPSQSGSQPQTSTPPGPFVLYYQPLWPFSSYAEAEQWRTEGGGSQPWHLDAGQTALNFTQSYLGFTEIDQVTSSTASDAGAHIGVGYRDPNGELRTSAILHLVRYGNAADSPWEVVGSDDTTFTLEEPAYGSQVSSPMTIGGHITGVDENIVVSVLASQTDRATLAPVPAGGDHAAWTTGPVSFDQRGVLTIVASTGGHVQQVERFTIQGVHT